MKNTLKHEKAYWLLINTDLTEHQIAEYCEIDPLEVNALVETEHSPYRQGHNLILFGELTREEIERCEADPDAVLVGKKPSFTTTKKKISGKKASLSVKDDSKEAKEKTVKKATSKKQTAKKTNTKKDNKKA